MIVFQTWRVKSYCIIIMEPLAYLILSNLPGENRLKNLKYFLRLGDNVIGTDPRCQIVLPFKYEMMHHAVNIGLGHNFLTIEALHPHLVYVQGNLGRFTRENNSDNYFPLAVNAKYLPKIGQFFYIGRIKAVIGSAQLSELVLMKNIVNRAYFILESLKIDKEQGVQIVDNREKIAQANPNIRIEDNFEGATLEENVFDPDKLEIREGQKKQEEKVSMKIEKKEVIEEKKVQVGQEAEVSSEKSRTERLDQEDYILEPTIVLEDGMFANEPTINLDECPYQYQSEKKMLQPVEFKPASEFSQKKSNQEKSVVNPQQYSQQILMAEIRRHSSQAENPDEDIDFSMPDTIVDKQPQQHPHLTPKKMQVTFKQVQSKQEEGDQDQMPPTIQDAEEERVHLIKPSKTMHDQINKQRTLHQRLYKSDQISFDRVEPAEDKNIQNFDDLFGIEEPPKEIQQYNSLPAIANQSQVEPSLGLMHVSSANQQNQHQSSAKGSGKKRKKGKLDDNQGEKQDKLQNRVNIVGFKPTAAHRDFLKKQGYELVANPHNDYELLLVKEPIRLCNRLLHALLDGKRIQSEQWIFNKDSEIQSKINGLTWKQIYEKKGTHGQPLKGKGRFYVSKRLEQLLEGVVEKLGGDVVEELSDKRRVLTVILRAEDSMDTELYLQNREVKKWRFVKSEIIVDCVLTGRYSLEEKYIIDLFKNQEC